MWRRQARIFFFERMARLSMDWRRKQAGKNGIEPTGTDAAFTLGMCPLLFWCFALPLLNQRGARHGRLWRNTRPIRSIRRWFWDGVPEHPRGAT